jgi:hypothetical protein
MPTIRDASDIPTALLAVLGAVADGALAPDEAGHLATLFDCLRASFEVDALTAEVEALKARVAELSPQWPQ